MTMNYSGPMPAAIAKLPRDHRGYPVPYFVQWIDGVPDFRVMHGGHMRNCMRQRLCWICGERIARVEPLCFVIGPMCAINRLSAEPPSHVECAEFAARACPFLTLPKAKRREANMPEGAVEGAGVMLKRNPGVALLWLCERYNVERTPEGPLFRLGPALECRWFCEGRAATRAECLHSIDTGYPMLRELAESDGPSAVVHLEYLRGEAEQWLPAA